MKKVTTLVLMLCLVFSGAFCYANGVARTEGGAPKIAIIHEGVPKESQFLSFGTSLYQRAFPSSGGFCNPPVSNTNTYYANHLRDNI